MQYETVTYKIHRSTQINKSAHSEMGPVRQKPNPENCNNCSS